MVDSVVLVTGGAGFIGSHTADLLLKKGYRVRVLDNLQPRVHRTGVPEWVGPDIELIQGDVANRADLLGALDGVDYVFHLAAHQDYLPEFSSFMHTNAESAALLFELIVERHLPVNKIVFASSQSVAGEGPYQCLECDHQVVPPPRPVAQLEASDWEIHCPACAGYMRPLPIGESVASPGTVYAISKYAIELLADRLGRRYEIPTVCMRYTYVQGPRNSFFNAYSGIARIFGLRILHDMAPVCYEDGKQLRDYVNIRDVAAANVLALESDLANFEVLNVGGARAVTVEEFARIMVDAFGSDLEPEIPGVFRLGDTRHTVSDTSRLRALGWAPGIPIEQSIAEYAAWLQTQQHTEAFVQEAERVMWEHKILRMGKSA